MASKVWIVSEFDSSQRADRLPVITECIEATGAKIVPVFKEYVKDITREELKKRQAKMQRLIEKYEPEWILAFGNIGLQVTTGKTKVMDKRGKIFHVGNTKVIPCMSPGMARRSPRYKPSFNADVRFFIAQVLGRLNDLERPRIKSASSKNRLLELRKDLMHADRLIFDVETHGTYHSEFSPDAAIVTLALTLEIEGKVKLWVVPLHHPESPWRLNWKKVLKFIGKELCEVRHRIAHNGKYDCRWLTRFGVPITLTFDTMLAVHILDENREKGLKSQALTRLGVAQWAISTKNLYHTPLNEVLKYNALDTFYTYHIYLQARDELREQPRLLRIFQKLMMPASNILIGVEQRGVWIDREKLATNMKIAFDMRGEIDRKLMDYVPMITTDLNWPTTSKGKYSDINFNPSKFSRWWLFEHLGLPVIETGKTGPSMREAVMLELRGKHPVVDLLLERSKWQKYCSTYLPVYDEIADENDRIHTSFKLFGTVTGRLSSGKEEADKITARVPRKGINLQQVPRDTFIRGLFGAQPGWTFIEADFSQIELRIAAFLSRDRTMLHLYQIGADIHRTTGATVLGKPEHQLTSEERKKAKAVNFGFVYGMGAKKFVATAFEKYELVFSMQEARAIRKAFFDLYRGLLPWHARMRRLVHQYGRVQSPIGRVRHLPDIFSDDNNVVAEAERQAINSPVQSFASDMNLLAMILIHDEFQRQGLRAHVLGLIHDALIFEVKDEDLGKALPLIKSTMENLPLKKKFGVEVDVPIIADLKIGRWWSEGARELTEEEVYNWRRK